MTELLFSSGDAQCAATLHRPEGVKGDTPCVVMGNGFSLTREDGLPRFAERFAEAGISTLTFDFRHLGDSGGEPRQLIDYQRQRADLAAGIDHARSLDGIDADRIVPWGYSFAGGHVLHVAARDDRLAGAIAMFPMLDGLAAARAYGLRESMRFFTAAARAFAGRRLVEMPVTGPPGAPAVLNQPEAEPGFNAVRAEDSGWRNQALMKPSQPFAAFRPVRDASNVDCPLMLCLGSEDTISPRQAIERAADDAPRGELHRYPIGHFEGFLGAFDDVVDDQIEFVQRHAA
jgi:uncharacterized protein